MRTRRFHPTGRFFSQLISLTAAFVLLFSSFPTYVFAQGSVDTAVAGSQTAETLPVSEVCGPDFSGEATYCAPAASVLGDADRMQRPVPARDLDATRTEEVLSQRSESAKTYRLSDGYYEDVVSEAPVHYKNGAGTYIDLVTDLVPTSGSTYGTLSPLSVDPTVTFNAFSDQGALVARIGDYQVGLGYVGARSAAALRVGDSDLAP